MEFSESSRLYLSNYFVLDQAREEAHGFLERIVTQTADEVYEYLNANGDGMIRFSKYVQREGGYAEFIFERKEPLPELKTIDRWKFSMVYRDAMRTENLTSSTKCKVYCFTPQSHARQKAEIKRMASKMNLPDLFEPVEIDLLNGPFDEVVTKINTQFVHFYENFIMIVNALIEEEKSPIN